MQVHIVANRTHHNKPTFKQASFKRTCSSPESSDHVSSISNKDSNDIYTLSVSASFYVCLCGYIYAGTLYVSTSFLFYCAVLMLCLFVFLWLGVCLSHCHSTVCLHLHIVGYICVCFCVCVIFSFFLRLSEHLYNDREYCLVLWLANAQIFCLWLKIPHHFCLSVGRSVCSVPLLI